MERVNPGRGCMRSLVKVLAGSHSQGTLRQLRDCGSYQFGLQSQSSHNAPLKMPVSHASVFTLHRACPGSSELVGGCIITR